MKRWWLVIVLLLSLGVNLGLLASRLNQRGSQETRVPPPRRPSTTRRAS